MSNLSPYSQGKKITEPPHVWIELHTRTLSTKEWKRLNLSKEEFERLTLLLEELFWDEEKGIFNFKVDRENYQITKVKKK